MKEYCDQITEDMCFLAASPQMLRIRQQILQIAPVDVPVFICGESGVGKEVVARMIHLRSNRRSSHSSRSIARPCQASFWNRNYSVSNKEPSPEQCDQTRKIRTSQQGHDFSRRNRGNEPALQAKLLHVLQDQQYSRLGGRHLIDVDVRVLAATNMEVQEAMKTGRLREDLYYRLNVLSIQVPPLRERTQEIPMLFRHFLKQVQREIQQARTDSFCPSDRGGAAI